MSIDLLSTELLETVAYFLNALELGNFRLTCRRFAEIGLFLIPRNGLSLLNTSDAFDDLRAILKLPEIANHTKRLVLYDGEWPWCSKALWKTHPLLFRGNSRFQSLDDSEVDEAFARYIKFITKEQSRRFDEDDDRLATILSILPNLQSIVISDMQFWVWHPSQYLQYSKLQQRIWIAPYQDRNVTSAVQRSLRAFQSFGNITNLSITGSLDPADLDLESSPVIFPNIRRLSVSSIRVCFNEDYIVKFLQGFPDLTELSVGFEAWGSPSRRILALLFWPRLEKLRLDEMWSAEEEFFHAFEVHQQSLTELSVRNSRISQGSWKSLFTRIRDLRPSAEVIAEGYLHEPVAEHWLEITIEVKAQLANFVKDINSSWPFKNE